MDQRQNNGSAGSANLNQNNNATGRSSVLSSQAGATGIGKDCVTPKGWSPQPKFIYSSPDDKLGAANEKPRSYLESKFTQQYRRMPKVRQKQLSLKQSTVAGRKSEQNSDESRREVIVDKTESAYDFAESEQTPQGGGDGASYPSRPHSKSLLAPEVDDKGFKSLKRMWSEKGKSPESSLPQQLPRTHPRSRVSDPKPNACSKVPNDHTGAVTDHQSASLVTSSSSNCSVRTTSFNDRTVTWHYVTAQPPTIEPVTDASSSKTELEEPGCGRTFDSKILSPRPFKAATAGKDPSSSPRQAGKAQSKNFTTVKYSPTINSRRQAESCSDRDSGTSSGEAEDSDEAEMRRARKRGILVTRFDSRGNMYKVNPRTGEVTYVDDSRETSKNRIPEVIYSDTSAVGKHSSTVTRRTKDDSTDGTTVSRSKPGHDLERRMPSESSSEEIPPPLLPRDSKGRSSRGTVDSLTTARMGRASRGPMAPPTGRKSQNGVTSGAMYATRKVKRPSGSDASPNSAVPPPLLPRENWNEPAPTQEYTPMSAASGVEIPIHDKTSAGRTASLDQGVYEPMSVQGGSYEPMEPQFEDDKTFVSYSAAVDPPKRKLSLREYHEIDPDPEVPMTAANAPVVGATDVPPPPDYKPPSLPDGDKSNSRRSSQNAPTSPNSPPPPLPPLNTSHKRLNYVDVELRGGVSGALRGKSQKTTYSEVTVGGRVSNDENDPKKGKSVKEKIMSMLSTKSRDGYASEGDVIVSSKNNDERTTDFNKERNKLKRLSGRILRKRKQKSRQTSRQSGEIEPSSHSEGAIIGVYGSATDLSTTSSESSRSLSHVISSGSSGDGQTRHRHNTQGSDPSHPRSDGNRRQSYEPPPSQMPPKMHQKCRSEAMLNSPISHPRSQAHAQNSLQRSAKATEGTASHHQTQKNGRDGTDSPITAPRVQSHLHQHRGGRLRDQPPSLRPVSEPPVMKSNHGFSAHTRPMSTPYDLDPSRKVRATPLPAIRDAAKEDQTELGRLSPNFPSDAPPSPPPTEQLTRPAPPSHTAPSLPPAPMRDLKPDRFKKRVQSGVPDAEYTAAEDVPSGAPLTQVEDESGGDPIYDDVYPDMHVAPLNAPRASAKSKFLESEPLYQIYRSRTLTNASRSVLQNPEGRRRLKTAPSDESANRNSNGNWQSDLMTDDAGATTLWKEVEEVVDSGVEKGLTNEQMKLQQAQFEVVTSQASYMRSLNILTNHFMSDAAMVDSDILPKQRRKELFSNVMAVRKVEQSFLQEIEQHFWDKLYLTDIANITAKYAESEFEVYVRYVQNQVYQDRVLTDLQRTNDKFAAELSRLESSPSCNKLPLLSFMLLPMQRVTRLPLLISAIVNQADSAADKKAYDSAKRALGIVNKLVKRCNEGARKMQQTEQLAEIAKELVFASKVKTYALVSQSRSVVKKGEMVVQMMQENKKAKVLKLWLFLFSDVLLLARKKTFLEAGTNVKYEVIDWAKRAMLYVNERAVSEDEILLVLLENCTGKRVELVLNPVSPNELSRWTDALSPQRAGESEDSIYESWDCPQYQCIVPYVAVQPDELTLDVGDVMRVLKKTGDGWLEGERLRDNEMGWFPADSCEEIEDEHVRARNLRNLYRIEPAGGVTQE